MVKNTTSLDNLFTLTDDSLFARQGGKEYRIGSHIEVFAIARIKGHSQRLALIRFKDLDEELQQLAVPLRELKKESVLRDQLADAGYIIPNDKNGRDLLSRYLAESRPEDRITIVHQPGWQGEQFVLPDCTIGDGPEKFQFEALDTVRAPRLSSAGSLAEWRNNVAALCATSSRLVLGICAALSAPLMRFTQVESGFFHLVGPTSIGKTLLLLVARSVSGPALRTQLISWEATEAGIEQMAAGHNHGLMCLDEFGLITSDPQIAATKARKIAFKIAGGAVKLRSSVYDRQVGNITASWELLGLSTGEQAIGELASAAAMKRLPGETVRFIDVPAVADSNSHHVWGIFETLPNGYADSISLVDEIEENCRKFHGRAYRVFIKRLLDKCSDISTMTNEYMEEFHDHANVPNIGWERRFARRFALAYAAGVLGVMLQVLPWDEAVVKKAITSCYQAARSMLPDADKLLQEGLRILRNKLQSPAILDLAGSSNHHTAAEMNKAAGFLKRDGKKLFFAVKPSRLDAWLPEDGQASLVLQHLDNDNLLLRQKSRQKPGSNTFTKQVKITGIEGKPTYYCIRKKVLQKG